MSVSPGPIPAKSDAATVMPGTLSRFLTDVSRDGMLVGLNFELIKKLISNTKKNIIVGGGLAEYSDIKVLKNSFAKSNIEGFIAGKSIYSGQIDIEKAMKLLNSNNSKNA